MDTPDKLGVVVEKDVPLLENGLFEVAAAARHGNGRDWWIVAPNAKTANPKLYRFLLTPDGIQGPFEQKNAYEVIDSTSYGGGQILLFTPDGSKLIQYHIYYGFIIYDFDRCTGLISNPVKVLSPVPYDTWEGLDMEVSANSRFAYVILGQQKKIVQYDLYAPDIALSGDTVAVYDGFTYNGFPLAFGWMERAPNGKIYIAACCFHMHVIENPDLKGAACDVRQHSVELPTWIYGSLPYMPNYRLYDLPGSPCDTLGINDPVSAADGPTQPGSAFQLYPNPASSEVWLAIEGGAPAGMRVALLDVAGRVALSEPVAQGAERKVLALGHLPAGLYFVRVEVAGNTQDVFKLSILR
ncbi:MAG: T9SS type A sorting domain-containing protein [Saprospiraceae bacterium]